MQVMEWSKIRHNNQLDVGHLHAHYIQHAYPRHSHDYYVICLIERGHQSFTHKGEKHLTPAGGIILINPGAVHTGEAVDECGFEMRSLYPTISHMERAVVELTGHHQALPFFNNVRVDDSSARSWILTLHKCLSSEPSGLVCESIFLWTLANLIKRYADATTNEQRIGNEKIAVRLATRYIDEFFAQGVSLYELAQYVSLSPYYLLRVFCNEVGMPPYAYLESVRIRHAQRLIKTGKPLSEVAIDAGFSSQSHMTQCFRKIIGATPGQYAQEIRN